MSFRPLTRGNQTQVITERGTEIQVQYAVVELSQLITSHDSGLRLNKKYPAKLQPRDRGRLASAAQIDQIAKNIRPELLMSSPKASDGAPIIGSDYIVESGNARGIAMMRGFKKTDQLKRYVSSLVDQAKVLGLDVKKIRKADKPVLVRLRLTDVDRVQFAQECNEQSVAAMSAVEQAKVDAEKLDAGMLSLFQPDDHGNIATASNRDFVRAFVDRAIGPTERGRFMDAQGFLSQDGVRRIQHALIAKAYGEDSALERLAEATEDNVRRISVVMVRKSAQFACLKLAIEAGARHPYDITEGLARVMQKISALRDAGKSVEDELKQQVLCGDGLSELERTILATFDEHKSSTRTLEDILQLFLDSVDALGHPGQRSMLDAPLPTLDKLLAVAIERATAPERKLLRLAAKRKGNSNGTWDRSAAARKAWGSGKLLAKKLAIQKRKAA